MRKVRKDVFERWNEKVSKKSDCWEWTGSTTRGGYGHFRLFLDGQWKMYKAHRYAYEHYKGAIPQGLLVCHTCDNTKCVNPDHLWLGTAKDNVRDMLNKGRKVIGQKKKGTNLNMEVAKQIRKQFELGGMSYPGIAKMFNTSTPQVCRIVNNKIWKE